MKKNATPKGSKQKSKAYCKLPKANKTVRSRVLAYLLEGGQLTRQDGLSLFHTVELPVVIHELRHTYGFNIITQDVQHITQDGRKVIIARYSLPAPPLAQAEIEAFCQEVLA